MKRYFGITTVLVVVSCAVSWWCADAFTAGRQILSTRPLSGHAGSSAEFQPGAASTVASMSAKLGTQGLLCYGLGFGFILAMGRGLGRQSSSMKVSMRAADIEVAEAKSEITAPYLQNIPRTIMDKTTLDKLLGAVPKEQWDDPPEESYLYFLKAYAETYGEGKATKMGWWDFWYMRINMPEASEFESGEEEERKYQYFRTNSMNGTFPMYVPGPSGFFPMSNTFKWRGAEPFAGDQIQSIVSDGKFSKDFLANCAFYRDGLKPWQRGIEIGMAHGYFIIGPFVSTGPLRNTPEAATVGLLCGVAVIGLVSVGGLIFGSTIKPDRFDREGQSRGAGFIELINWHALGGVGGAGFAHALITIFGS